MKKSSQRKILSLLLALAMLACSCAEAASAYKTLSYGSKGASVKEMQTALKALGYYSSTLDGKFGSGTQTAVKNFQKAYGLTVDGKAGTLTLTMLYSLTSGGSGSSSSAKPTVAETVSGLNSTLRYGSSGSAVLTLQTQLKELGYYKSSLDGKYGSGTQAAVKAFQKANSLTADGLAGARTRTALQAKYDAAMNGAAVTSGTGSVPTGLKSTTLALGSAGDAVKTLQTKLKALGYYSGSLDGKFGSGTQSAVTAFQKANGLSADGLAGTGTQSRLDACYAALSSDGGNSGGTYGGTPEASGTGAAYNLTRTLKRNASGEDVKAVQRRLKELGYYAGAIDGSYGSETIASVTAFQNANGLSPDGNCGTGTWAKMSSSSALTCSSSATSTTSSFSGSNGARIYLMHWTREVKPGLANGNHLLVCDPDSGITWTLRVFSRGRHCDCEPLTAEDTARMNQAFGGVTTWGPKAVYVQLPGGRWTLASTHNTPHESQSIKDNNFNGHLCVHFLRDMTEAVANDSNYGVQNQNTIRTYWKQKTGETIY